MKKNINRVAGRTSVSNMAARSAQELLLAEEEIICLWLLKRQMQHKRRRPARRLLAKRRLGGEFDRVLGPMRALDEEMHFSYFRMSALRFDELLHRVEPFTQHDRTRSRLAVTLQEKLAITLRLLASGSDQESAALSCQLDAAMLSSIVSEVCQAIWKALRKDFVFSPTARDWTRIACDFWRVWNFPNCVGAIDARLVQTKAPAGPGRDSFHNKDRSVVLLAACDAEYRFTVLDIGAFGSESDGGIFRESVFGSQILQGTLDLPPPAPLNDTNTSTPHVFLGDEAFPLNVHLMRPYSGINLDDAQTVYNYRHSRARRVIENAFGVLAARWRILGQPIDLYQTVDVVKACVALHNMLTYTDAAASHTTRYIPPEFVDGTAASGEILPGKWRRLVAGDNSLLEPGRLSTARASQDAVSIRDSLKSHFQTAQGFVPWQDSVIRTAV